MIGQLLDIQADRKEQRTRSTEYMLKDLTRINMGICIGVMSRLSSLIREMVSRTFMKVSGLSLESTADSEMSKLSSNSVVQVPVTPSTRFTIRRSTVSSQRLHISARIHLPRPQGAQAAATMTL